jgi:hypothetical protein
MFRLWFMLEALESNFEMVLVGLEHVGWLDSNTWERGGGGARYDDIGGLV